MFLSYDTVNVGTQARMDSLSSGLGSLLGNSFPKWQELRPCNPVKNSCVHARGAAAGSGFGISCGQMYICYPPTDF